MSHYTKRDILRLVEEEDVEFIRLQFADLFGNLKNAAVTAGQRERVLDQGYVFDGSCVEGFLHLQRRSPGHSEESCEACEGDGISV